MNVVGIVAEFNPLHNGHAYLIKEAKETLHSDYCVVVMSGDYVQRGEPAFFPKEVRAKAALMCGADLVLELPISAACASAEFFAHGSVSILHGLGVITHLCFGSESGNIDLFTEAARLMQQEPSNYRQVLSQYLRQGYSYPRARYLALSSENERFTFDNSGYQHLLPLLESPNNILGLEYCRSLASLHSTILPYTIKRMGASYHEKLSPIGVQDLSSPSENLYPTASASGIRDYLLQHISQNIPHTQTSLSTLVPNCVNELYNQCMNGSEYVLPDEIFPYVQYKILSCTSAELACFHDVSNDLADRIIKMKYLATDFHDYCQKCKSKNYTYSRISRALLHIALDIKKEDVLKNPYAENALYGRVLAFKRSATPLLSEIKKKSSIPFISKLSDCLDTLSPSALNQLRKTMYASDLYHAILTQKTKIPYANELAQGITILP